jgi:hypothetical protein
LVKNKQSVDSNTKLDDNLLQNHCEKVVPRTAEKILTPKERAVFAIAPFSSAIVWGGACIMGRWNEAFHTTAPVAVTLFLTVITVALYYPLAVFLARRYVEWRRHSLNAFGRLLIAGLLCGTLIGSLFNGIAHGYFYAGLLIGAVVGLALGAGTYSAKYRYVTPKTIYASGFVFMLLVIASLFLTL